MTESDLKKLFHSPYKREVWIGILKSFFPSVEITIKDVPIPTKKNTRRVNYFGKVNLPDGKSMGLFEVEVTPKTQIARNRIALRENVRTFIDYDRYHGVLAIFYHPNQPDYRFSFVAGQTELKDGVLSENQTHPKRFTYVLGTSEPCTTPAKRFLKLLEKKDIKLEDVIETFEVETLTKEFFKKYKEHYESFCDHLIESKYQKSVFKIPEIKDDEERKKAEKPIRDFVKKLLGRVVFLYFLQKKGWMGVPKDRKDWAGGDPEFMKNLFARFDDKKHFYSRCLVRLFFETLNTNRPNDLFEITDSRIPYLNGGLFDDDLPESNTIDLPADLFQKLFEFFGEYNFTIDENSPDDHEVGIDPEMLGHIFENLLEDNKDKGAYYTPKAIVHYMCQESLIQYLKTHLASTGHESTIERFIRIGDRGDENDKNKFIRQNAARIEELLDTVKICDPAIGSGAFPMGLLQEILKAKSTLDWTLDDRAKTKRNIIQNSIYGVDIDKGAVDIARLRFWLALVVDEEVPEPLPNLDYKIMQGNSLLESFEGIDLSKIMNVHKVTVVDSQMNLLTGKEKNPQTKIDFDATRRDGLHKLLNEYFLENDKVKKIDLHRQIDRVVLDHIHASLEGHKDKLTVEVSGLQRIIDDRCAAVKTAAQRENIRKESKEAKALAEKKREMAHVDDKFEKLRRLEETSERPYFLWHLFFKDVFDQDGFDIVIGNPPYLESRHSSFNESLKDKLQDELKRTIGSDAKLISRGSDLLIYFLQKALQLLCDNGRAFQLTHNSWLSTEYGKKFQSYLLKNATVNRIIDSDFKYFDSSDSANINTLIVDYSQKYLDQIEFYRVHVNYEHFSVFDLPSQAWGENKVGKVIRLRNSDQVLDKYKWGVLFDSEPFLIDLLSHLELKGKKISEVNGFSIGQGLNIPVSSIVDHDFVKEYRLAKGSLTPFVTHEDGNRYNLESTQHFLINPVNMEADILKRIKKLDVHILDSKTFRRPIPKLIMPRGVSKYYCAYNQINAYGGSTVDVYADSSSETSILKLWVFLNSSLGWLLREISGRKNLGGGLLKAEAVDLNYFPIYYESLDDSKISRLFGKFIDRTPLPTISEIQSDEHMELDSFVFDSIGIARETQTDIRRLLSKLISARISKAKT